MDCVAATERTGMVHEVCEEGSSDEGGFGSTEAKEVHERGGIGVWPIARGRREDAREAFS